MNIKKSIKKLTALILTVAMIMAIPTGVMAAEGDAFVVNGKTVTDDFVLHSEIDCSGSHGCCLAFAKAAYLKLWDEPFVQEECDNLLDGMSPDDQLNTPENWEKFMAQTKPGAIIRVDDDTDMTAGAWSGHNFIFLELGADGKGAYLWEGNADGQGSTQIKYYAFSDFATNYYSKYTYFRYIAWPGAKPLLVRGSKDLKVPELIDAVTERGAITVSWESVSKAKGYNVYRKVSGGSWKRIASVSGKSNTSYTDYKVKSGNKYYYTVAATKENLEGCYDESGVSAFYMDSVAAEASNKDGYVKVEWNEVGGAEGYRIERKTGDGDYEIIKTIKDGSKTSYKDEEVKSGKKYTYRVKAYIGDRFSKNNTVAGINYLSRPSMTSVETVGSGIKLKWKEVKGASGYNIYRKTKDGSFSYIGYAKGGDTLTYKDMTGVNKTRYYYEVKAYKGDDTSLRSDEDLSAKVDLNLSKYETKNEVNYRTGPGTGYAVVGSINKGKTVKVVVGCSVKADDYTWYRIYRDEKYYYVASKYLKKIDD